MIYLGEIITPINKATAMPDADFKERTIAALLATHRSVLEELRKRKVIRSRNNPIGDYTEWLVSESLGLTLNTMSAKGFDAIDSDGLRYQIKGRQVTRRYKSTQLGVIRNLNGKDFDYLVAVIFDENWQVQSAAKIPHQIVQLFSTFRDHVNGHVMHFRPSLFLNQGVENISHKLQPRIATSNEVERDPIIKTCQRDRQAPKGNDQIIMYEDMYLDFICGSVGGPSMRSYVSYLHSVSRLISADISPANLRSEDNISDIVKTIGQQRAANTIRNYCSAMRQYVAMVAVNRF